jgi:hypothetical protein
MEITEVILMSYNTIESAKGFTQVTLSQELLDWAQAIIHGYTKYRWKETIVTDLKISGTRQMQGGNYCESPRIELVPPIISVDSLTVEGTSLTQGDFDDPQDFEVASNDGYISVHYGIPIGEDVITITYKYGYTAAHPYYEETISLVKGAEAVIALFLKRNPAMTASLAVSGTSIMFSGVAGNHIQQYLLNVPKYTIFGVA